VVRELPQQVITMMARRPMRQHHYLWHTARNNWLRSPATSRRCFAGLAGSRRAPPATRSDSDSGEDFPRLACAR
jgi:hypothetical protein